MQSIENRVKMAKEKGEKHEKMVSNIKALRNEGLTVHEISEVLDVAVATVRNYVK